MFDEITFYSGLLLVYAAVVVTFRNHKELQKLRRVRRREARRRDEEIIHRIQEA